MKTHDYEKFAESYSKLEIKDTYYLAYRDIPNLIKRYVVGNKALDFGCGSGRSTRFLKELGFNIVGLDHNSNMIKQAKKLDQNNSYELLMKEEFPFKDFSFDLIFSTAVFMEIPSKNKMDSIMIQMYRVLKIGGKVIIVTDAEGMYKKDCLSFTYPDKTEINSGDKVRLIVNDTGIEFQDYYWKEKDYLEVFSNSGFKVLEIFKPLGKKEDQYNWISENKHPHWTIFVLEK